MVGWGGGGGGGGPGSYNLEKVFNFSSHLEKSLNSF